MKWRSSSLAYGLDGYGGTIRSISDIPVMIAGRSLCRISRYLAHYIYVGTMVMTPSDPSRAEMKGEDHDYH